MASPRKDDLIALLERFQAAEALLLGAADVDEARNARAALMVAGDAARALLLTGRTPEMSGGLCYFETDLAAERRAQALDAERNRRQQADFDYRAARAARLAGAR